VDTKEFSGLWVRNFYNFDLFLRLLPLLVSGLHDIMDIQGSKTGYEGMTLSSQELSPQVLFL